MATRLPDPLLTATLPRLPGWSRDEDRIRREFRVDGATRGRVAADLDAMARRLHHPIRVTGTPDGVAVALTTDEVHGVSEVDVALATRINALFGEVPPSRPAGAPRRVTGVGKVVDAQPGDGDEHTWWADSDADEPLMGVPAAVAGVMPAPLPDTAPDEAQPGVELEQESGAGHGLGFSFRGAGDDPER